MTQPDEWGRPAETGGEFVKPAQLNGHLVILFPIGYVPFIQTRFSGQSNKPSDGIVVDVVDLDDKDEYGNPGKLYRHNTFMQAQLIASLKSQIGSKILGVVSQGTARNGMNAPWVIVDMSGDQGARDRGQAWVQANPHFRPSTFTPRQQQPLDPQFQQPPAQPPYGQGTQGGFNAPSQPQYQQSGQGYSSPQYGSTNPAFSQPSGGPAQDWGQHNRPQGQAPAPLPAQPQYQQPGQQPQTPYAGVQGSAQLSDPDMSLLDHHRQLRAAAEAERQRQASFQDVPPF